jgi:hypothetical protein
VLLCTHRYNVLSHGFQFIRRPGTANIMRQFIFILAIGMTCLSLSQSKVISGEPAAPAVFRPLKFKLSATGGSAQPVEGELNFKGEWARWEAPKELTFSFAKPIRIEALQQIAARQLNVAVIFECAGEPDTKSWFGADVRMLDHDGKLLAHRWEFSEDVRTLPATVQVGSLTKNRSRWNGPQLQFPLEVLPQVALLDIRIRKHANDRPIRDSDFDDLPEAAITTGNSLPNSR